MKSMAMVVVLNSSGEIYEIENLSGVSLNKSASVLLLLATKSPWSKEERLIPQVTVTA
jgi:hypothetical protein